MSKKLTLIYRISTSVLSLIMLMYISKYLFRPEIPIGFYSKMGFPTYIMHPLALAKALGLLAVWIKKSRPLTEWAYAGFFFNSLGIDRAFNGTGW